MLEHISNVCADVSEKLQDKVAIVTSRIIYDVRTSLIQRFTTPVNVLEQLLGSVITPSVVIDLLPGHEGYTVSLSNRGGMRMICSHCTDHEI